MTELRPAQHADIPVLQDLIARSGRALSVGYYSDAQADAITRFVFGVDTQLIEDQTYFVIEHDGRIVACGGWSQRRTLFGGDQTKRGADPLLDSATEPARIRAFFVDPAMARRGLGRLLMNACAAAARRAGFTTLELVSTLPGEPLYQACGFAIVERFELDLPGDVRVPVSRMRMAICGSAVGDYTHPKLSSNNAMSPNKQTVQAYMEAFTRTDPPAILACLTDDVEWVIPGMFHVRGKDAFEREIENDAFTGSPAITVTRMTEAEGVVVAEGTVRCARKAGGFLNAVFCDVFVMQDAKIRQLTSYLMEVGE